MIKLPDKTINFLQLNKELIPLELPEFLGVARLSREVDEQGHVVLEDGAVKRVSPYILIKCGELTTAQETSTTKIVLDHIPIIEPMPDPRFGKQAKEIETSSTLDELKATLAPMARLL